METALIRPLEILKSWIVLWYSLEINADLIMLFRLSHFQTSDLHFASYLSFAAGVVVKPT